jgi:tyrosyl-tRNA synthetase
LDFLDELEWRGLLHQVTSPDLAAHLASGVRTGYCGFDPTSDCLTVGNLLPIMLLRRFAAAGHRPIALLGGGTGLVGDPSGKSDERSLQTEEQVEANLAGQRAILERLLGGAEGGVEVVNNADWLRRLGYLEVLRDVGKHFSVNAMIQRDSVATRLSGREHGISYTEFSYMVLQAYDYLHLFREHGCTVQMGGSDQFGNIVSGIDLIRRFHAREHGEGAGASLAFGVTSPLVTAADGSKIGKTERGATWLGAERTSPYRFHQFWLNASDADAGRYLRWFSMRGREEIEALEAEQRSQPAARPAQRALAAELVEFVHGPTERDRAEAASQALFSGRVRDLDPASLGEIAGDLPSSRHAVEDLDEPGADLVDLLVATGLAKSRREAREFVAAGAVAINGEKVSGETVSGERTSPGRRVLRSDLLDAAGEPVVLLRRGRKQWHAARFGG